MWPQQRQLPMRPRNPNFMYPPMMAGQNPLGAMPGMMPNRAMPAQQLARINGFNPLFPTRAALPTAAGLPFNNPLNPFNLNLALNSLQSYPPFIPYYPYNSPNDNAANNNNNNSNSSNTNFPFKTKDVTIRGKARTIRASYLLDAGKFEADLQKYMEEKKESDVPDKVLEMLISWINRETYVNDDAFDEVTLNMLASSVGCKSILPHNLGRLKEMQGGIGGDVWVRIIGTVMLSGKADEGLVKWMVGFLKEEGRWRQLIGYAPYERMMEERPEIGAAFMRSLGLMPAPDDEGLRKL